MKVRKRSRRFFKYLRNRVELEIDRSGQRSYFLRDLCVSLFLKADATLDPNEKISNSLLLLEPLRTFVTFVPLV